MSEKKIKSDKHIDCIVKDFLFNSLTEKQLDNLKDGLSKKDKSGLGLKPFVEIKVFHQLFAN